MEKTIHSTAYKVLREWLVEMRHTRQLTQRNLASLLDVPYSWVGKIELGERRLDIVEYVRICRALNTDPQDGLAHLIRQMDKESPQTSYDS